MEPAADLCGQGQRRRQPPLLGGGAGVTAG
jgi:hypothetical protein